MNFDGIAQIQTPLSIIAFEKHIHTKTINKEILIS